METTLGKSDVLLDQLEEMYCLLSSSPPILKKTYNENSSVSTYHTKEKKSLMLEHQNIFKNNNN